MKKIIIDGFEYDLLSWSKGLYSSIIFNIPGNSSIEDRFKEESIINIKIDNKIFYKKIVAKSYLFNLDENNNKVNEEISINLF